jgi:carboxynorspermidine decarboxylase
LAGDVIGDYSFDEPLKIGQRLTFEDMSHYTMVKTTTFNGTKLPSIAVWNSETNNLRVIKQFGYDDFRNRLS